MRKKEHDVASVSNVFVIQATCIGKANGKALASQWHPREITVPPRRIACIYNRLAALADRFDVSLLKARLVVHLYLLEVIRCSHQPNK